MAAEGRLGTLARGFRCPLEQPAEQPPRVNHLLLLPLFRRAGHGCCGREPVRLSWVTMWAASPGLLRLCYVRSVSENCSSAKTLQEGGLSAQPKPLWVSSGLPPQGCRQPPACPWVASATLGHAGGRRRPCGGLATARPRPGREEAADAKPVAWAGTGEGAAAAWERGFGGRVFWEVKGQRGKIPQVWNGGLAPADNVCRCWRSRCPRCARNLPEQPAIKRNLIGATAGAVRAKYCHQWQRRMSYWWIMVSHHATWEKHANFMGT